jgi:hypothetical protein
MSVRAKFYVGNKSVSLDAAGNPTGPVQVQLYAATSGDENKAWAKYTPTGEIKMSIDNPAAAGQFVTGRHYFLDCTPAD